LLGHGPAAVPTRARIAPGWPRGG